MHFGQQVIFLPILMVNDSNDVFSQPLLPSASLKNNN